MKYFYCFTIVIFLMCTVRAQEQEKENDFSISAQLRSRAEYRNGAIFPRYEGDIPAFFINNRARVSTDYKRSNLSFRMTAQYVGVWGQDPQIDKNGRFILNETWARINLKKGWFTQIGRQSLSYDDERILGNLDWNVAGRYHDALKVGFETGLDKLHVILAFNQNDEEIIGGTYYAPGGQPYKAMQTAWYHHGTAAQDFNISLLLMNLGYETGTDDDPSTGYLQTMGTYMTCYPDRWSLDASFYYQTGKNRSDVKVNAFMWALSAAYKIADRWSIVAGSDYLSGDKTDNDKFEAFDPLYGTHHKFYGSMDYFYASAFVNGLNPGLWDNRVGLIFRYSGYLNMSLNYHHFSITRDVPENGSNISKSLGSEFDLQINWNIMNDVTLMAGYSVMAGTSSMDKVKGGDHKSWQDWAWVSLGISPRLFSTKW